MNIRTVLAWAIMALLLLPVGNLFAADKDQDRDRAQERDQDKEMIYGYELMTVEERAQHRAKMRSFNTAEEREAYRQEHHKLMQARAREKGVTLPDYPMHRRMGPGPGAGSGGGSGAGKGR